MTDASSSPLDGFVSQFRRDEQEGKIRPLEEYLAMFPGDVEGIAEEYFGLKRREEGRSSRSTDEIGHYHLIEELGRGGQAIVFLAEDLQIRDRKVAVKSIGEHRRASVPSIGSRYFRSGSCPQR